MIAANKADNDTLATQASEFYSLGLGDPVPVSAYHGRGTRELISRVLALLPDVPETPSAAGKRLAIVGRPNVGKSMLLNALVGQERVIVDPAPGTTRDAVDTAFTYAGETVVLVDTAGMRRPGRIGRGLEYYSSLRTIRAIERCDVALLVLDATQPASSQDAHVAAHVLRAGRGLVIVANKSDLLPGVTRAQLVAEVGERFKFASYAPILVVSAKLGWGTDAIVPQAVQICREREKTVSASVLVDFVKEAVQAHPPPYPLRIKAIRQTGVNPPRFEVLVNDARVVHFSYRRYLQNRMRQFYGFDGTPLIFSFKSAKIVRVRAR
ncbi:MAG: ribosome biogenesis GTPase Der [Chloroflexota bacterium]